MISCGKASLKAPLPTVLRRRIPLSSSSSSTDAPDPDGNRPGQDAISKTKELQTSQQQVSGGFAEAASSVQSPSKAAVHVEHHHIISPCESFSSAKECGFTTIESAYQVNSNGCHADVDHSYSAPKPFEIDDDSSIREKDQVFKPVYCGRISCTSIKAEPDLTGTEPFGGSIGSPQIHPRDAKPIETSNSSRRGRMSDSEPQLEKSISPAAEGTIQRKESTPPGQPKIQSTDSFSITPAQSTKNGELTVSRERNVDMTNENCIRKQIVQVVIPLAPSSQPHFRLPLATTETEDPASVRRRPATVESAFAALGPNVSHQGNLAFRTPTMSPSIAAAESQYAAPAASVYDGVRASPGPEIADSQPESTMPFVAIRMPQLGEDATRPIILDDDSPPLTMSPGVAPSTEKQLNEATKNIIPECNLQPLRITLGITTPTRKQIEEALEPDILESGSRPLSKPPSAARSLMKRTKEGTNAKASSSIWTAIDDYSEDELSYL